MADNVVTYLLELDDKVSAGLRLTSKRADELDAEIQGLRKSLKGAGKTGDSATARMRDGLNKMAGPAAAAAASAAAVGVAFAAMGVHAVKTSAMLEGFETRLGGLLGGLDEGKARVASLFDIAASTPFQIEGLVEAEATLEAFGVNAPRVRQGVMDLAGAMGMDLVEAARAVGKGLSAGAGAADLLREKGVLAMVEVDAGMAASQMTAEQFREALVNTLETNDKLAGGTERMALTFDGLMSTLRDQFTIFSKQVADSNLFATAKATLTVVLDLLGDNRGATKDLATEVGSSLTGALMGILSVIAPIGQIFISWRHLMVLFKNAVLGAKSVFLGLLQPVGALQVKMAELNAAMGGALTDISSMEADQQLHDAKVEAAELSAEFYGVGIEILNNRAKMGELNEDYERLGAAGKTMVEDVKALAAEYQNAADASKGIKPPKGSKEIMTIVGVDKKAAQNAEKAYKLTEKAARELLKTSEKAAGMIQDFNSEVWGVRDAFEDTAAAMQEPMTESEALTSTLIDMSRQFLRAQEVAESLGPAGVEAFESVKGSMLKSMNEVAAGIDPAKAKEKAAKIGGAIEGAVGAAQSGGLSVLSGAGPGGAAAGALIGLGQQGAAEYDTAVADKAQELAEKRQDEMEKKREQLLERGVSEARLTQMGLSEEDIEAAGEVTKKDTKSAEALTDRGEMMSGVVTQAVQGVIDGIKSIVQGLPDILMDLIPMLLVDLPKALMESFPDLVEQMIPLLLWEMPKAIITMLVGMIPRFLKMLFTGLIPAMVRGIGKWWRNVWKALKDLFTIDFKKKHSGGFIPRTDNYLLSQGERVVPSSGASTGTARKGLSAFAPPGSSIVVNTNVVNPDAIPELSRLIDREMGALGRATVPVWGSTSPPTTL